MSCLVLWDNVRICKCDIVGDGDIRVVMCRAIFIDGVFYVLDGESWIMLLYCPPDYTNSPIWQWISHCGSACRTCIYTYVLLNGLRPGAAGSPSVDDCVESQWSLQS